MELKSHGQYLSVDSFMGGAIKELTLSSNGIEKTVISPQEGYHYESSLLFPFPNRLKSGKFNYVGETFQFPLNDFGRPNALHGLLHDKAFEITSQQDDEICLSYSDNGDTAHYPFPFKIDLTYKLTPGELKISVSITNTGDKVLPCSFGWHPYFNLPEGIDPGKIQLQGVELIEVDEMMIPSGKKTPYMTLEEPTPISGLSLDTCFHSIEEKDRYVTRLFFPDSSGLEVWQDSNHPYTQIYTPEDGKTIAIEPMTSNIDALNNGNGLSFIAPKKVLDLAFGVRLS